MELQMQASALSELLDKIRDFRGKGQFESGHKYVCSLAPCVQMVKPVAIEISQLYIVQGHFIRANVACETARVPLFESTTGICPPEVFDDYSVCLELLHAYIGIMYHSKLYTALRKARRAYELWLGRDVESQLRSLNTINLEPIKAQKIRDITKTRDMIAGVLSGEIQLDSFAISDSRILLEFWYYKILVVCAEQGLTDEPEVSIKKQAASRMAELHRYMASCNRIREARYLLYFSVGLLGKDPEARQMLEQFLHSLQATSFDLEKAQTHLDLAEWQIRYNFVENAANVDYHLREAECLFDKTGYTFGSLDAADLCLLMPGACPSSNELLRAKCELADKYFSGFCYTKGLRCLISSIPVGFDPIDDVLENKIHLIQQVISEIGAELLNQIVFIQVTSQSLLRAPEYGHALRSLESYVKNPPEEIGPKYHSYLYLSLRKVYSALGDSSVAIECARRAFEISSRNRNSYIDRSDAAAELGVAEWDARVLYQTGSKEELRQIEKATNLLQTWVENDRLESYVDGERLKCHQLAIIEDYLFNFHHIAEAAKRAEEWIECCKRQDEESPILPYKNIELELGRLINASKFEEAIQKTKDALKYWQSIPHTPMFQTAQALLRVGTTMHLSARNKIASGSIAANQGLLEMVIKELFEAIQYSYEALKTYRSTGGAEMTVSCANHVWLAIQDVKTFLPDVGLQLLRAYLQELEISESFCDSIRRSLASSENIKSLLSKRRVVSNEAQRKLYLSGVLSCIQIEDFNSAWMWIQKGKARALSDIFGLRAVVPSSLLQAIREDPEADKLYQQERKSLDNAIHASPQGYVSAARKATADREVMKQIPLLSQLLAIREGAFDVRLEISNMENSLKISKMEAEKLKYVDWYFVPNSDGAAEAIVMFVRDLSGKTSFRQLQITASEVQRWIRKVFNPPEGAEPELKRKSGNRTLWELNGLLQGLAELTSQEDLLILSPSGILNSIPLHGLKIGDQTMIDRNLVIYSSSASVLRQCQARAAAFATTSSCPSSNVKTNDNQMAFLALYEDDSIAAMEERTNIFTSVRKIAQDFHGVMKLGPEVTKTSFQEACRNSSWLFYHGHAIYGKEDVLDSGLVLSDDQLTISDIFESDILHNAPHITMIACDSGTQHIAPGDEPLGIVPALLFAGATSVLGCIWPIESWSGRVFSEKFYKHLNALMKDKETGPGANNVVNLAIALRGAVREMMDKQSIETRLPYFWASFVLHGCWFHEQGNG